MTEILRIYVQTPTGEVCIKTPTDIIHQLTSTSTELDLDYNDARGHSKMGSSRDFIGKTVRIGEYEFEVPEH